MKLALFAILMILAGCHDSANPNHQRGYESGMRGGFEPRWHYDYNCTPGRRPEAPDCRYYR